MPIGSRVRSNPRQRILFSSVFAALLVFSVNLDASPTDLYAVPPGQEELVLDMLGRNAALPSDCKLASASIDKTIILASYECGSRPVTLRLEHPSSKAKGPRTLAFTLVESGELAPGLLEAVEATVRQHEESFRWIVTKPKPDGSRETGTGSFDVDWTISGLLGILASLALVGFVGWKRKRAPTQPAEAVPPEKPEGPSAT